MKKSLAAIALIVGFTGTAAAADLNIHADVGTTGIGFHAMMPLNEQFTVRAGLGYLGYSHDGSTSNMEYKLKLKSSTYDALLDWHPVKDSGFRVTAGVAYNGNKINVVGETNSAGNYTMGGNTYSGDEFGTVRGKVSYNKIAPYLGVGWGSKPKDEKGWSVSTDVGVMFQGSAKTSLSSSGCTASAAACGQFANDLARENRELRRDADRFKAYPVLRVGVSYKF